MRRRGEDGGTRKRAQGIRRRPKQTPDYSDDVICMTMATPLWDYNHDSGPAANPLSTPYCHHRPRRFPFPRLNDEL